METSNADALKLVLTQIVDRLSDLAASVDALELELVENGVLTRDAVRNRFHIHKGTVEDHLALLRTRIQSL